MSLIGRLEDALLDRYLEEREADERCLCDDDIRCMVHEDEDDDRDFENEAEDRAERRAERW